MSILLCKDLTSWLTNCRGDKIEQIEDDEKFVQYLDTNVVLEEGFTLKHLLDFLCEHGIYPFIIEQFGKYSVSDIIDESYEYISITPKYTLNIKNGVHIIDKSYNILNIETSDDDGLFIFDYMITQQVLNLEIRIEREVIEYYDGKFYMPADLTLRELFLTISDGIIES